MSQQPEDPDDVRGTWTITIEGGPATAANLATAVRSMIPQSWIARTPSMAGFVGQLVTALEQAQFTPVRRVELRRRSPEEARARLLSSSLPPDLAAALADEIAPHP